jgi:hypothetical protein
MRSLILAAGLGVLLVSGADAADSARSEAPIRSTPFPDVPRDHWAFEAVEDLRKLGILRGYPPAPAPKAPPRPARKPGRSAK